MSRKDGGMSPDSVQEAPYEAPVLRTLGSVAELTLYCDKTLNGADGFTFMGQPVVCRST